jgi:hypothetical protein
MVTLDQIKLLETKVAKAIDHINKVTEENSLLKGKLETYRKRVDELEGLVKRFKDDQSRIEEGILSALDRLNQFEDAIGKNLVPPPQTPATSGQPVGPVAGPPPSPPPAEPPIEARPAAPVAPEVNPAPSFGEETALRSETAERSQVPGMYLSDEDELPNEESEEIDEDEDPDDRSSGELDIF